jgi:hypothetical protein
VEAPRIKEVRVKLRKLSKLMAFRGPIPNLTLNANVLFGRFSLSLTLFMTKLRVLVLSFPDFADTSTMHKILDSKG